MAEIKRMFSVQVVDALTIDMKDVDATCQLLNERGIVTEIRGKKLYCRDRRAREPFYMTEMSAGDMILFSIEDEQPIEVLFKKDVTHMQYMNSAEAIKYIQRKI